MAEQYGPIVWDNAPPQEAEQVGRIVGKIQLWETTTGLSFRERCNRFYQQYRGFREFRDAWTVTQNPRDRDGLLYDAKKHWGAHLHIPMSFRTIETIVPRAIANMPKILILPRDEQWVKNVETIRLLIDKQQNQIDIDLALQAVMRSGRIYGLGAGKTYWRTETQRRRQMEPEVMNSQKYVLSSDANGGAPLKTTFDDPMFEDIDIFDFMWDPYGSDTRTCEWMVHRVWMSAQSILQRVESKAWNTVSAQKLTPEAIENLGPNKGRYDAVWSERLAVSGFTNTNQGGADAPHELLEFHDGERVYSILDRQVLVQDAENPCGEMPFQIYRPTPLNKQMVGIGDLEPIEDLQRELDTLRSQRRDAATMTLAAPMVYDSAAIDPEELTFGPNMAIESSNARPQDALMKLQMGDIPGSGYKEEEAILRDMGDVAGIQEQGPSNQSTTATEASLVQAALSARIELSSRRFEIEVPRHVGRCFLYLDQRMISENRGALVVPGEGEGQAEAMESGNWRQYPVGPGELEGEYEIEVEGGSMSAKNVPQERADATWIMQNLAHDWFINPTKARLKAMEKGADIKHPSSWLRDPTPTAPMTAFRFLISGGVDPTLIMQAILRAREVSAPQEGPTANQITEQIGTEGTT